jgi:hypothetical protein
MNSVRFHALQKLRVNNKRSKKNRMTTSPPYRTTQFSVRKSLGENGMTNRISLARTMLVLLCASLIFAPNAARAVEVKKYDFEVGPTPGSIYWIGDDRIVFKGLVEITENRITQYTFKRVGKLATLDLNTGKVEWGDEFTGELCVDGEKVAYFTSNRFAYSGSKAERFWLTRGTLDNLTTQEVTREELQAFDFSVSCKPASELPQWPKWKNGIAFWRLRPEHGAVETFASPVSYNHRPTRLHRSVQDRDPIPLRPLEEKLDLRFKYYSYEGAYFFTSSAFRSPLPENDPQKLYWLYPDGQIKEIATVVREKDWPLTNADRNNFVPTKNGLYFAAAEPSVTSPYIGKSALYRFIPKEAPQRIVAGRLASLSVSPDGCQIAIANDDRWRVTNHLYNYALQVVNVCKGK